MSKKKAYCTRYDKIHKLNEDIRQLTKEIDILENIINSSAADRAQSEWERNVESTPLWYTWFNIFRRKKKKPDDGWDFGIVEEACTSYCSRDIRLSEAEMTMLKSFKESERELLRKDLQEVINRVNETEGVQNFHDPDRS